MTEGSAGKDAAVRGAKNEVVLRDLNERLKAYTPLTKIFSEWCASALTCPV